MNLNYEQARGLEGKVIRVQNNEGKWVMGRVVKVRKDGLELEEVNSSSSNEGYGYGFWGPRPFFRPFIGFGFPFFFW
ncbi:hypothetical protein [Neobacillus vireti]|uniref:Uncharacterized protein n=1 Tax=Neobacillus vireti LMG 21834 TaxID=1131730 RepID=A0AB94IMA1_9BACI|nr:hypothetical protein [Neobacillus vireti]ETI68206.1 hypothetical protein BAVI_13864 [Neobacillus vireti LMG 21834]KLT17416.1 hypothetical protein AA980_16270 [Neobacillus vireti]